MIKSFLFAFFLLGFRSTEAQAPDFSMKDPTGHQKMLSDFEGEVVYLSFWASWCGACKHNFYKYKNVRRQLQDMGVILINVSMDKNEGDWVSAMEKQDIIGHHFRVADYEKVMKEYNIRSFPNYEIVNKRGILVYLSEEANRDIFKDFEKWMSEIP